MTPLAQTLLKILEGFRPSVYKDKAGHPTIGFGHKLLPGEAEQFVGREITRTEADELLVSDFGKHRAGVLTLTAGIQLEEHEVEALTSFAFNVGEGALGGSTLLKRVRAQDRRAAAQEFTRWHYVTDESTGEKVSLPWQVRRRHVELSWYLGAPLETLMYLLGDAPA